VPIKEKSTNMKLQNILNTDIKLNMDAIGEDLELARQIQIRLISLELLSPPADGKFGPISAAALKTFQDLMKCNEPNHLGTITAEKLIETKIIDFPKPALKLGSDLASRIIKYMQLKNYKIFTEPKNYNIVYIEGMNPDGTLNNDDPNVFNDLRIVIEFQNGVPKIVGMWEATTEPGSKYTYNPMNPKGAARIQFGQYTAWSVGLHGTATRHEALVQVRDLTVCRDFNKDFSRTGDELDTGIFAINQHWGYDYPKNNIGGASAGCLVGRSTDGHREFMRMIKQDKRYQLNNDFIFTTAVIPGDDLNKKIPS
jgi:hypothetical protein